MRLRRLARNRVGEDPMHASVPNSVRLWRSRPTLVRIKVEGLRVRVEWSEHRRCCGESPSLSCSGEKADRRNRIRRGWVVLNMATQALSDWAGGYAERVRPRRCLERIG